MFLEYGHKYGRKYGYHAIFNPYTNTDFKRVKKDKYKATFNTDREVWNQFLAKCKSEDKTGTEILNNFISFYLSENSSDPQDNDNNGLETFSETERKIQANLFRYADRLFTRLEIRMDSYLRTDNDTDNDTDTDDNTDDDGNTDNDTDTNTDVVDNSVSINTVEDTDADTDSRTDKESIGTKHDLKIKYDSQERLLWSDRDIAEEIGVSATTICRYRKGTRATPEKVSNSWEVSKENPNRWICVRRY